MGDDIAEIRKELAEIRGMLVMALRKQPRRPLLTVREVAEQYRRSRRTIYDLCVRGIIPAARSPGRGGRMVYRIRSEDAERCLHGVGVGA